MEDFFVTPLLNIPLKTLTKICSKFCVCKSIENQSKKADMPDDCFGFCVYLTCSKFDCPLKRSKLDDLLKIHKTVHSNFTTLPG